MNDVSGLVTAIAACTSVLLAALALTYQAVRHRGDLLRGQLEHLQRTAEENGKETGLLAQRVAAVEGALSMRKPVAD